MRAETQASEEQMPSAGSMSITIQGSEMTLNVGMKMEYENSPEKFLVGKGGWVGEMF